MAKNKYNRPCPLCKQNVNYVDYKNIKLMVPHLTKYGKIVPKYYSGICLKHQKQLSTAVKRAREMALVMYIR